MQERLSPVRRFLLWWMRHPNNPHVSANFAVDFSGARDYLDRLNAQHQQPRVSVHHLFTAAVGRTFAAFPSANARILGNTIRREPHVGVAAPVNLLGHEGGGREVSMMVMAKVDQKSLREIAAATRKSVAAERKGEYSFPWTGRLMEASEWLPDPVLHRSLDLFWAGLSSPYLGPLTSRMLPVTVGITNPGSAFAEIPGVYFRGGAFNLPGPGWCVGAMFGVTPVQQEVVALEGQPAVRPVLPVMFVFDHRLFDGVMAGRIIAHLSGILREPEPVFGPSGERRGA